MTLCFNRSRKVCKSIVYMLISIRAVFLETEFGPKPFLISMIFKVVKFSVVLFLGTENSDILRNRHRHCSLTALNAGRNDVYPLLHCEVQCTTGNDRSLHDKRTTLVNFSRLPNGHSI